MKLRIVAAVLLVSLSMLAGCFVVDEAVEDIIPNQPPIVIGFGASHSPNGPARHKPYEWDVCGIGYDPDGEIVSWTLTVNGDTFRTGTSLNHPDSSVQIRYQFPQRGWYPVSVTAVDDDGAETTFAPEPDGLWEVKR